MDAVARAFAQDADRRRAEADAFSALERMREGWALGRASIQWPETEHDLDQRALAQAGLHARWRALRASKRG
jgi:hypothetical protein